MARPRNISFTLNNYTDIELAFINKSVDDGAFKYFVCQQERGAVGTPHLQGYAQRANPTTLAAWKLLLSSRIHIEESKGSAAQNRTYCTKDTDRLPGTLIIEKGEIPVPGERKDLSALVAAAQDPSQSIVSIIEGHGADFLRYHRGIQVIRAAYASPRDFKTKIFWFYGATGTGKTRLISELAPGGYWKQNSPWWCGYDPSTHGDVIIDEYRGDFSKFTFLLSLFDRYPLQVQCKGGNCQFRARRIFISTPFSPQQTWESRKEEDLQQLYRRIEVVVEFIAGGIRRLVKGEPTEYTDLRIVRVDGPPGRPVAEEADEPPRQRARVAEYNTLDDLDINLNDLVDFDFDNELN